MWAVERSLSSNSTHRHFAVLLGAMILVFIVNGGRYCFFFFLLKNSSSVSVSFILIFHWWKCVIIWFVWFSTFSWATLLFHELEYTALSSVKSAI